MNNTGNIGKDRTIGLGDTFTFNGREWRLRRAYILHYRKTPVAPVFSFASFAPWEKCVPLRQWQTIIEVAVPFEADIDQTATECQMLVGGKRYTLEEALEEGIVFNWRTQRGNVLKQAEESARNGR